MTFHENFEHQNYQPPYSSASLRPSCSSTKLVAVVGVVYRRLVKLLTVSEFRADYRHLKPTRPFTSNYTKQPALAGTPVKNLTILLQRSFTAHQRHSQKLSTGGASICSIPFCPFPFSCPTKSAVQSKNVMTYHTAWMIEHREITYQKNMYFPDRGCIRPLYGYATAAHRPLLTANSTFRLGNKRSKLSSMVLPALSLYLSASDTDTQRMS